MNPRLKKWVFTLFLCGTTLISIAWYGRGWEEDHCVEVAYQPPTEHLTSMGDRITLPAQTTLKCDNGRMIVK